MDIKLDHAEKLVENLNNFIGAINRKWDNSEEYNQVTLNEVLSILVVMKWEAEDYLNGLKRGNVINDFSWTAALRESLSILDAKFISDSTDTLFVFFPQYITIHSGVKALEW
jgi:hypothetical protein